MQFIAGLRGNSEQHPGDFELVALSLYLAGTRDVVARADLDLRREP